MLAKPSSSTLKPVAPAAEPVAVAKKGSPVVTKKPTVQRPSAQAVLGHDHLAVRPRKAVEVPEPPEPEIFMADMPVGALETALTGVPVKLVLPTGGSLDLAIAGTPGAYAMTLGDAHIQTTTDQAGLDRVMRLALNTPASLQTTLASVAFDGRGVDVGLTTAGAVHLTPIPNAAPLPPVPGAPVKAATPEAPHVTYALGAPGACVTVTAAPERDVAIDMGLITGLLLEQPAALRGALEHIAIDPGASPVDEFWAGKFNKPGFTAGGTAGFGTLSFWETKDALDQGTFDHEFGHLIAQHFATDRGFVPDGWEASIKADGKAVSSYAVNNAAEDFAESWRVYSAAKVGRPTRTGDPATLADFEAAFPQRAKALEAIADGTRAPLVPIKASCSLAPAASLMPAR